MTICFASLFVLFGTVFLLPGPPFLLGALCVLARGIGLGLRPEAALGRLHILRLNVGFYETYRRRKASINWESEFQL